MTQINKYVRYELIYVPLFRKIVALRVYKFVLLRKRRRLRNARNFLLCPRTQTTGQKIGGLITEVKYLLWYLSHATDIRWFHGDGKSGAGSENVRLKALTSLGRTTKN